MRDSPAVVAAVAATDSDNTLIITGSPCPHLITYGQPQPTSEGTDADRPSDAEMRAAAEAPPLRDALHAWEIRKAVPPADRGPLPYATASRAASLHPPSWLLTFYFSVCLFVFPEKKTHHQHQSLHVQLCGRAANVTDEFVMF